MTRSSSESSTRRADKRSPSRSRRESHSPDDDDKQMSAASVGEKNQGKDREGRSRAGGAVRNRRRPGTPGTIQCRHCWRVIDNNTTSRNQHAQSQYCVAYQYKNAGKGTWAECVELAKADLAKAYAGGLRLKERPKSPEQGPRHQKQADKEEYVDVVVEKDPPSAAGQRAERRQVKRSVSREARRSRSVHRRRDRQRSLSRARSSGTRQASRPVKSRVAEVSRARQSVERKAVAKAKPAVLPKETTKKKDVQKTVSKQPASNSYEYYPSYSSESPEQEAVEKKAETVTPAKALPAKTPRAATKAAPCAPPAPAGNPMDANASDGTNRREDLYNSLLATAIKTVAGLER